MLRYLSCARSFIAHKGVILVLLLPTTACSIRFITWPASYLDDLFIYFRVTFYLSLRFMFNIRCFAVDDLLIY